MRHAALLPGTESVKQNRLSIAKSAGRRFQRWKHTRRLGSVNKVKRFGQRQIFSVMRFRHSRAATNTPSNR